MFDRIGRDEAAIQSVGKAKLIIRLNITDPAAVVVINGRKTPPHMSYAAGTLRPDLDITLSADTLHHILLRETGLRVSITAGKLSVRGPVWKSLVLEDIFHSAQALYPQVLAEMKA